MPTRWSTVAFASSLLSAVGCGPAEREEGSPRLPTSTAQGPSRASVEASSVDAVQPFPAVGAPGAPGALDAPSTPRPAEQAPPPPSALRPGNPREPLRGAATDPTPRLEVRLEDGRVVLDVVAPGGGWQGRAADPVLRVGETRLTEYSFAGLARLRFVVPDATRLDPAAPVVLVWATGDGEDDRVVLARRLPDPETAR